MSGLRASLGSGTEAGIQVELVQKYLWTRGTGGVMSRKRPWSPYQPLPEVVLSVSGLNAGVSTVTGSESSPAVVLAFCCTREICVADLAALQQAIGRKTLAGNEG